MTSPIPQVQQFCGARSASRDKPGDITEDVHVADCLHRRLHALVVQDVQPETTLAFFAARTVEPSVHTGEA
jgi:hypothetical protein